MKTLLAIVLFLGVMISPAFAETNINDYLLMDKKVRTGYIQGAIEAYVVITSDKNTAAWKVCVQNEARGTRLIYWVNEFDSLKDLDSEMRSGLGIVATLLAMVNIACIS